MNGLRRLSRRAHVPHGQRPVRGENYAIRTETRTFGVILDLGRPPLLGYLRFESFADEDLSPPLAGQLRRMNVLFAFSSVGLATLILEELATSRPKKRAFAPSVFHLLDTPSARKCAA